MFRKFNFFLLILLLSPIFCLTNTFADENGEPDEGFEFPVSKGPTNIPGLPEAQIAPEHIIGSPDFEKMRDLPTNSQDYQLGRKVGQLRIPVRNEPGRYWICTGFLVGPDLFMTNHHCVHDGSRLRLLDRATIYMDYYQERAVDPTYGGITARVSAIVEMDEDKDYALLRLDRPIGNTYGWLELDTTIDPDDTSQSVKLISHPQGRSKEIVRRNSQIIPLTPDSRAQYPYVLAYLADTERGSSGSPVFLRDGTGVIAIHHSGWSNRFTGEPLFNAGSLMSHIAPEIQQYLPGVVVPAPPSDPTPPDPALVATTLEGVSGSDQNARVNQPLANPLVVRVKDQNDAVMLGVSVSFTVAPGGTVDPSRATTGANGEAETRLTLGGTAGTYTVTARASGITQPVTFTATATAAPQEPDPLAFSPSTIADQTFTVGSTIQPLRLPVATGGTAPYTYSLSPILAGLSFNTTTRILSGTPTTAATATSIIYTARDAAGRSASLTFTITVRVKPIFTPSVIADQTFMVGEAVHLTLPTASGGISPYTYTLAPLPGGLSFSPTERELSGTPTTAGTTTATYTATDAANVSASLTFTIEITENNPPVFTEGASTTRTVAENTVAGTNIGSAVSATDADDDTLTYTLSGTDAAAFSIVSTTGQLRTLAALDYETKSIYTVSITASDGSLTDTISVTINVTDIAEEPVFTEGASTTRTVAENTVAGTNIGSAVSATDADDDTLTYTLSGTDAAAFSIVSTTGQLRTLAALNAAIKSVYSVTVTVSDGVHTVPISVIINVTDAEMPPVLDVNSDGVVNIFDLLLVAASFGATVDPTTPDPADVNDDGVVNLTDLLLVIGGMDSTAGVAAAPVLSEANPHPPTNNPPVFTEGASTTRMVAENTVAGTNIGSAVSATDADGDTLTYILSGTDAAAFSIVSTTGQLRTQAALNAAIKSVYSITVVVSDGVHTVPISIIINVTDAEMPPVLDVNSDGVVNTFDLLLVAGNFGATVDPTTPNPADVNDDGIVNLTDLLLVIGGMDSTAGGAVAAAPVLLGAVRPTPKETLLLSNYPNPFNPETWIPYHLATDAEVVLTIYNVRGVAVRTLTLGHQAAGIYESRTRAAYWNGRNESGESVASGVYFYTLTAGEFTATRKLLIIK